MDTSVLPTSVQLTLIGIESLLCLQEACEDNELARNDIGDIFYNNARRLLAPYSSALR